MPSPLWLIVLLPLLAAGLLLFMRGPLLRRFPGLGTVLRHGRWPRAYNLGHAGFVLAFPILMVSGTALYLEAWHRALIAWLPLIRSTHVWLGITFAVVVLLAVAGLPVAPRRPRWVDWSITALLTALLTLSGFALWLPGHFPSSWDAIAFSIHGWLSYAWMAWLVFHAVLRLISFQHKHPLNARFDYRRRDALLGALGATAAGAAGLSLAGRVSEWWTSTAPIRSATWKGRRFPAYYTFTGDYPNIDTKTFRLRVDGRVDTPLSLSLAQIEALEAVHAQRDFVCVTGWSVPEVDWTGVRLETLLKQAGMQAGATHLIFHSADGEYVDQLTLAQASEPGVMLAYRIGTVPLPVEGGFPLRLVVPSMYGYKSVKWVDRIEVARQGVVGTWERYGYADDARIS